MFALEANTGSPLLGAQRTTSEGRTKEMPRPLQRACLEAGLKLDLNRLMREGCIVPNAYTSFSMRWRSNYWDEEIASAEFTAHMVDGHEGRLHIRMDHREQTIFLVPRARRFGGHQWYFVCPVMNRCCSVLWRPPGSTHFRCRQGWGRAVAYASQFLDPDNRAHHGKAKIKANRYVKRFDRYGDILEDGIAELMAKFLGKYSP
jgi:hypothetical protein